MNKSEQVDLLLDILTRCDLDKYREINEELLKNGVDFSKIPQDKLAFAVNRFHADLKAKESNLNGVQIVTPRRYARMQSGNRIVTARDVAAEISVICRGHSRASIRLIKFIVPFKSF